MNYGHFHQDPLVQARKDILAKLIGEGKTSGLLRLPGMDESKPAVASRCGRMIVGTGKNAVLLDPLDIGR